MTTTAPILVTGASGQIGGKVAELLTARGAAVRVIARSLKNLDLFTNAELTMATLHP